MSPEAKALAALHKPAVSRPGDMWLCRRLGSVKIFNAHKRGSRKGVRQNSFYLYHFGGPSLYSHPCDWRDDDPNAYSSDPAVDHDREHWEYIGNVFDLLPYQALAGEAYKRWIAIP